MVTLSSNRKAKMNNVFLYILIIFLVVMPTRVSFV